MKETDEMTTLAEAAEAYRRTKQAHDEASEAARDAVLAALKAGNSVPKVAKEGPFTYAYVRRIAEENGIPRDERKARYPKTEPQSSSPTGSPRAPLFISPAERQAELVAMAERLPISRLVELVERLEYRHRAWLRSQQHSDRSDLDVVKLAIQDNLIGASELR